ncbi:MAG TPA: hypothetical protein VG028_11750 [Terriglobia bacterium]|nr:hypothetical protein [Terriglobia bacterium]
MRLRFLLFLGVAAALMIQPLHAAEQAYVKRGEPHREGRGWVERADCGGSVQPGARLVLRADMGSVTVRPGPDGQVVCHMFLRVFRPSEQEALQVFRRVELSVRTNAGGGLYLVEKFPSEHERNAWTSIHFDFTVPERFSLDLETKGGDVSVGNLNGELRASTAGGDIQSGDISGPVSVDTAGGDIDLGNMGGQVVAQTAGGSIRVNNVHGDARLETSGGQITSGLIEGSVRADTSGGDIVLRGASGPVTAETAGGQIQIGQCGATIRAETAGGSIHLQGAKGGVVVETAGGSIDLFQMQSAVRAMTSAGRILAELDGNRDTFGASHLETSVGDVQVFLPPSLPINIDALIEESMGHRIVSDFPLHLTSEDEDFHHGPKRGEGELNGGGKVLRIRTVMGNIEIHKIDSKMFDQIKMRQDAFWKRWEEQQQEQRVKCCQNDKKEE